MGGNNMLISAIVIQNFRKLYRCHIDISKQTTLFVGANNSGKTSAMDALNKFLASRNFVYNDITISNRRIINSIGDKWVDPNCEQPSDLAEWDSIVPKMDIWLEVADNEFHYVSALIPTLKWRGGRLGVRLALFPKDISKLFADYRKEFLAARKTESYSKGNDITLFPKNLCEFLSEKMTSYFSLKSFILDPSIEINDDPIPTKFELECLTDNPLKGIVKIDIIDAQRGFSDPDSTNGDTQGRRLSKQMSNYYKKHLDPEKEPSPEDLSILVATEKSKIAFDEALACKFKSAIDELETLGYPGVTDPKLTISSKVSTSHVLEHDSSVQYTLSSADNSLKLPEKYNGLGYQNLISMAFDLIGFRDDWMKKGKASYSDMAIEPLHLVLVEEPEAHLHVQVQQVFIRKAYEILIRDTKFTTQLVISTHSSHIARECDFSNLRYFKRLPENTECSIATSKVINLSDVFGKDNETNKFVTRYLQTTHCDLFFADAAILVEGAAENILLPHFIRSKYTALYQRYISILSINGRHSHRLRPLIEKLCLPTLVITDIDPVESTGHHKGVCPNRGKGYISSNYAITHWLIDEKSLDKLLDISSHRKEKSYSDPYNYAIRFAYQTPVRINIGGIEREFIPSTFEDSLVYSNYETFKMAQVDETYETTKTRSMISNISDILNSSKSVEEICKSVYEMFHKQSSSPAKAEFALDVIYAFDPDTIEIPQYISEGLEWLQKYLGKEE